MWITQSEGLGLRIESAGAVLPWIGPALRGLVAGRLKAMVCRHPRREREARWHYCDGCPHLNRCAYGRLFEPPAAGNGASRRGLAAPGTSQPSQLPRGGRPPQATGHAQGMNQGSPETAQWIGCTGPQSASPGGRARARPVVVAPYFPLPGQIGPGYEVPVRILLVGRVESFALDLLCEAVADVGRKPGIGPDRVRFRLAADRPLAVEETELRTEELPAAPDALRGIVPRLGVGLTAPLFLLPRDKSGQRQINTAPQFVDLFRASEKILHRLFAEHGETLDVDIHALDLAAQAVEMIDHCYEPFEQVQWSTRRQSRRLLKGVVGGAVFRNVPLSLLPWLVWGGRLHAGSERVCGAGSWRLVLD